MAKTKPPQAESDDTPPADPHQPASSPADPLSRQSAITPAHVLVATLGIGSTPAAEIVADLDDAARAELVRIYGSDSRSKALEVRQLLARK